MSKRKVALLMAAILTVTSVYPGGVVFAEDAVTTGPVIEAAADEISEDVNVADPAEEQTTASGEGTADDPTKQAMDDAEADLEDDEATTPVGEENVDSENIVGNQVTDLETDLPDAIRADGQLEIDLSDDAMQSVPVATEAGSVSLTSQNKTQQNTVKSAELTIDEWYCNVFRCCNVSRLACAMDVTVTYGDGSLEELDVLDWQVYPDEEEDFDAYDSGSYLWTETDNGNRVELTCYQQGTDKQIGLPAGIDWINPGSYTIKLTVDGELSDTKDITIDTPALEDVVSLENLKNGAVYTIEAENECQWYSFEIANPDEEEYVIQHIDDSENSDYESYVNVYSLDSGRLYQEFTEESGSFSFYPMDSTTYYIAVYREWLSIEDTITGTIAVKPKAAVSSVELQGIMENETIDPYEINEKLRSLTATITYFDGEKEVIREWTEDRVWTDLDDDIYEYGLQQLLKNGDTAYLILYSGEMPIDIPRNRNKDKNIDIPMGKNFFVRLTVDGENEVTSDSPRFNIGIDSETKLGVSDEPTSYVLTQDAHNWYSFAPDEPGDYVVSIDKIEEYAYLYLYRDSGNELECVYETEPYEFAFKFKAQGNETYHIVLVNDTHKYGDPGNETPTKINGTICVKKHFIIDNVELENLPEGNFVDIFEPADVMSCWRAKITYEDGPTETVSDWGTCIWDDCIGEEYTDETVSGQALSVLTSNGDQIYLTLWENDKIVNEFWSEYDDGECEYVIREGTYTLKLYVNDETVGAEKGKIHIGVPEDASVLNQGVKEAEYELQPQTVKWYKLDVEAGEHTVKNERIEGDAEISLCWKKIGSNVLVRHYLEPTSMGTASFTTSEGQDYWLVVHTIIVPPKFASGKISITEPSHKHQFQAIRREPTCTKDGSVQYKCSVCGWIDPDQTETLPAPGQHDWGAWKTVSAATVLAPEKQQRECTRCHEKETKSVGNALPATITVPATKANMKTGQSTGVFTVGMSAGDSIASVTSSNTKLMKVKSFNPTTGVIKLKAGKKTGKVKITVKLASGQSKAITLTVQKKKVTTKKVKVTKKLTIKKGAKYTLKPVITPITTQDKVKFKSSNKKIAAVTNKGAITAKKPGKVTITVTCGKKKATCKITVTN